jgi:hypothetical protein
MLLDAEDMTQYATYAIYVVYKQMPDDTDLQIWDLHQSEAARVMCA